MLTLISPIVPRASVSYHPSFSTTVATIVFRFPKTQTFALSRIRIVSKRRVSLKIFHFFFYRFVKYRNKIKKGELFILHFDRNLKFWVNKDWNGFFYKGILDVIVYASDRRLNNLWILWLFINKKEILS